VKASASRQYAIATSSLAGAAQTLQQASAGAAGAILNPEGADVRLGTSASTGASVVPAPTRAAGFRTPFREDGGLLYLIDQRKLPHEVVEYPCRSAGEVAFAIRELIVRGAPAIGQAAAIGLAIAAEAQRDGRAGCAQHHAHRCRERPHQRPSDGRQPPLGGRARARLRGGVAPARKYIPERLRDILDGRIHQAASSTSRPISSTSE
jgi:hypothetical protein